MFELVNGELRERIVWRQGRVSRTNNGQAAHTRPNSGLDLVDVVAQEEPSVEVFVLRMFRNDLRVAINLGLGPRIRGIEVVGDERRHVWLLGVCVRE